jgi:hypothetical protein
VEAASRFEAHEVDLHGHRAVHRVAAAASGGGSARCCAADFLAGAAPVRIDDSEWGAAIAQRAHKRLRAVA